MRKDIVNKLWAEAYVAFLDWKEFENMDTSGDDAKYYQEMALEHARIYDSVLNQMTTEQYCQFIEFIESLQYSEKYKGWCDNGIEIDINGDPEPRFGEKEEEQNAE